MEKMTVNQVYNHNFNKLSYNQIITILGEYSHKNKDNKTTAKQNELAPTVDEKEYNVDFLTEKNVQYLIEIFKQPVYFNMLPDNIKELIKVI